jgi:hypothetical protein
MMAASTSHNTQSTIALPKPCRSTNGFQTRSFGGVTILRQAGLQAANPAGGYKLYQMYACKPRWSSGLPLKLSAAIQAAIALA